MKDQTLSTLPQQVGCNPRIGELQAPDIPGRIKRHAAATNDPRVGVQRLDSGGFRAERGHGFRDGNKGLVLPVQEHLRRLKLYGEMPDGKFGKDTERAVKEFQRNYNAYFGLKEGDKDYLPVTGEVDYYTWGVLKLWNPQCKEEQKAKAVEPTQAQPPSTPAEAATALEMPPLENTDLSRGQWWADKKRAEEEQAAKQLQASQNPPAVPSTPKEAATGKRQLDGVIAQFC